MIVAKWKNGFETMFKADAQLVAEEIRSIGEEPTTKQIVDAARDPKTELHKCFEWDDAVAAEKYRLKQAQYVVHFLVIQNEPDKADKPEIRVFHKTKTGEGYKEIRRIVRQEDEYQALLERALAELHAFKIKYACLSELQEIFDLID